jgi:putative hydrolase of the HAD superfamily
VSLPANPVWLFDLDDTLHQASHRIFPEIHLAMGDYLAQHLGLSTEDAGALRSHYWRRYGATLLGLIKHHDICPRHFLKETHRFDDLASLLVFAPELPRMLKRLPGRKIVFSNAPRHYAKEVLKLIGVAPLIRRIVAIEDTRFIPKPARESFFRLIRQENLKPASCILVEDSLPNLATAKRLGMATVWVSRSIKRPAYVDLRIPSITALPGVLHTLRSP